MIPYQHVSGDAQRALENFSEAFAMAYAQDEVEQWAAEISTIVDSSAIKTTFPIPISAAGYKEFKGDVKYRQLFEKSIDIRKKLWQDGVAELASIVEAPDFIGWVDEPMRIAIAGRSVLNELVAAIIESNPTLAIDGKALFATDHPVNVLKPTGDVFSNLFTGAGTEPSHANLALAKQYFRALKAPNGKPAGYRMTHVLTGSENEEQWRDILERDLMLEAIDGGSTFGTVNNRHKGTVKLLISDELSGTKFYPLALNKPGARAFVGQDDETPEEIRSDKDSPLYTTKLMVGVAYVKSANAGAALPQPIQSWDGTPA